MSKLIQIHTKASPFHEQSTLIAAATQITYEDIMDTLTSQQEYEFMQSFIHKLSQRSIRYDPEQKGKGLRIRVSETTLNWQVVTLEVNYGPFSTFLNILNMPDKSNYHTLTEKYCGNFSTTDQYSLQAKDIATKCIPINNFHQNLYYAVKQYFVLLLASCLESGPAMDNLNGFHILVYSNCIEFSMEFCKQRSIVGNQLHLESQNPEQCVFSTRYKNIQRYIFEGDVEESAERKIIILLNQQESRLYDKEKYLLSISEIIQLNDYTYDFNTKQNVCILMKKLYLIESKEKTHIEDCLHFLFHFASSSPITQKKVIILTRILISIIILELKTQVQLVEVFKKVIQEEIEISYLLELILRFLTSIQWIRQKYQTSYQVDSFQSNILHLSQRALFSAFSQNLNQIDRFACKYLHFFLNSRKNPNKIIQVLNKRKEIFQISNNLNQIFIKIIEQINIYFLHTLSQCYYQSQQQDLVHTSIIRCFQKYLQKYNKTSFEYFHFFIYKYYRSQKRNDVAETINRNLRRLLQPFLHANVYKMDVQQQFEHFRLGNLSYYQFMTFLLKISDSCDHNYRIYIADYFTMMLSTTPYLSQSIEISSKSKETKNMRYKIQLQYCKRTMYQYTYFELSGNHKHTIIEEISILKKIFVLYYCKMRSSEYNQLILIHFFQKIEGLLQQTDCIQCKVICLLDMIPVRMISISNNPSKLQQLWNIYIETLTFCIHQPRTHNFVMYYATLLITLYLQHPVQFINYNPFLLYHHCIKALNNYSHYLLEISKSIFIQIYNYFYHINDTIQLHLLVHQLLVVLKEDKSYPFSQRLYGYVGDFVNLVMNNPTERMIVFERHRDIISMLMKNNNEYIGIYFYALLPSVLDKNSGKNLILGICNSLNSIDAQSKKLILNNFYQQMIKLHQPSSRQKVFWQRKHQKHTNNPKPIKINIKSPKNPQKIILIKALKLKLYHRRANNQK